MKNQKLDQKEDQEPQQYSAKTHAKIAIYILMIGWFPMLFVCAFGIYMEPMLRTIIALSSLVICGVASISMIMVIGNPAFWKTFQEIEELKEDYRVFKAKYQKALQEFVQNQNIEK